MKFYDVVTKKEIKTKSGEVKNVWNNVGRIVEFDDGGLALELSMFPETKFSVFQKKAKEVKQKDEQPTVQIDETIKEDDLDF